VCKLMSFVDIMTTYADVTGDQFHWYRKSGPSQEYLWKDKYNVSLLL
jgi:hypothetical protein